MGSDVGGSSDLQSDINVTPLVDVMLVLLIIFMMVTPLLQTGVAVSLPQARNVRVVSDDQDRALTVAIQATGEVFVDGASVDPVALSQVLAREHTANPSFELHVKADRNAPYGEVRRAIRAGRDAGFRTAALVAEEIEDEASSASGE